MEESVQETQPTPESASTTEVQASGATEQVVENGVSKEPIQKEESTDTKVDENWTWNGNVDELPKPLQERGKGMLRSMHKATQEAAALRRKVEEQEQSPEYQEYLRYKQHLATQPLVTEDEWAAAQTDPNAFNSLVSKTMDKKLEEAAKVIVPKLTELQQKLDLKDAQEEITQFAEVHKDFWEIHPMILKAAVQDKVVENGGTIEDAYYQAKEIEKVYKDKVNASIKAQVESKKHAVSVTPTPSSSADIVYVEKKEDINKVAFQYSKLGKKVDVRLKK